MSRWDAFSAGIAGTIAFRSLVTLAMLVLPRAWEWVASLLCALVYIPLVIGIVGVGIWRMVFLARLREEPPRGAGRLGLSAALGMVVGYELAFARAFDTVSVSGEGIAWVATTVLTVLIALVLLAALALYMRWMSSCVGAWLITADTPRKLRRRCALSLALGGLLAVPPIASLLSLLQLGALMPLMLPVIASMLDRAMENAGTFIGLPSAVPMVLLYLIALWALPLAGCLRATSRPAGGPQHWMVLDGAAPLAQLGTPSLPLRPLLWLAVVGSLAVTALWLGVRVGVHLWVPEAIRHSDAAWLRFFHSQVTLTTLAQLAHCLTKDRTCDNYKCKELCGSFVHKAGRQQCSTWHNAR